MCDPEIESQRRHYQRLLEFKDNEIATKNELINYLQERLDLLDSIKDFIKDSIKQSYIVRINDLEEEYESLITAKDNEIDNQKKKIIELEKLLSYLSTRKIIIDNSFGGTINISGAGAFSLGDISGIIANNIDQMPSLPKSEEPEIKDLLIQLKTAIEQESELNDKLKKKALMQVQIIVKASQKPVEEDAIEAVEDVKIMFDGIISRLPAEAELINICNELFPLILSYFDF